MKNVISKAEEDHIITSDEKALIEAIKIEGENLESELKQLASISQTSSVLRKVLATSSKIMLKNMVSKARQDGRITNDEKEIIELLFKELGFELTNFDSRPWFNFKVCININPQTDMTELLSHFDKVFCLRGIDPNEVYSGLCLGTKHYVIEDVDVTLLTFAITPETTQEWVRKGAFAIMDYSPNFSRVLYNTAYDLIVENYFSKIS